MFRYLLFLNQLFQVMQVCSSFNYENARSKKHNKPLIFEKLYSAEAVFCIHYFGMWTFFYLCYRNIRSNMLPVIKFFKWMFNILHPVVVVTVATVSVVIVQY